MQLAYVAAQEIGDLESPRVQDRVVDIAFFFQHEYHNVFSFMQLAAVRLETGVSLLFVRQLLGPRKYTSFALPPRFQG